MLTSLDSDFVCMPVWGWRNSLKLLSLPTNSPSSSSSSRELSHWDQDGVFEHRQKCAFSNNTKALCRQNSLNLSLWVVSQNYEHSQCAAWLHVCHRQKSDSVLVLCSLPQNLVNRPFSQSLGQGLFWDVGLPVHQRGREGKKWCGAMEPWCAVRVL